MATDTQQHVDVDVILQMTESFLGKVTAEQLELVTSGVLDISTKILLTALPLELLSSLTNLFFIAVKHKDLSEHCDFSGLKHMLVQSFSEALGIDKTVDHGSISRFSEMMQKEVTENVKSIRSTGENNIIPPVRLNMINSCVLEMLTTFANKLVFAVTCQKEHVTAKNEEDFPCRSDIQGSDSRPDKGWSDESVRSKTPRLADSPAEVTATEIICHLIEETPDVTFQRAMVQTSRELLCADEQVTRFIFNSQKNKNSFKKVSRKFKEYFTVCFTRVWISRLLDKLSWNNPNDIAEHSDVPQLVVDFVLSYLSEDTKEGGDRAHSLSAGEDLSGKRLVMFMSELRQLLYSLVKQQMSFYSLSEGEMYDSIKGKVWIFTVLMNWWVHDQMSKVTERMNSAQADEEMKECEGLLTDYSKVRFVFILVEKVVLNLYYSLKIMPTNIDKVIKHVFEKVLDKVQGTDLYFRCRSSKIYKTINTELLRRFGSLEAVLFLLNSKDPVIEECFVTVLKQTMMKPPKTQNAIQGFFSLFCMKNRKCRCP